MAASAQDGAVPPAALRLSFDAGALAANWRALDRLSGCARAAAAVKADAYGVGVDRAVPVLAAAGCRRFYVAHWQEVPAVARHVAAASISVLHGPVTDEDTRFALASGARPVLNSLGQVERWLAAGGGACELMIDTGMNRLGLRVEETGDERLARLDVAVLLSHLARAEEDVAMNARQQAGFAAVRQSVPHRAASLANSAGIMLGSDYHLDLTRPGLSLYGGVPRAEMAGHISPVVRPEAAVIQIRNVPAGETIGYNAIFTAPRDMRVAIIALGYADGYLRCWSATCGFSSRDAVLPVLGRVSMDMTAIDIGDAPWLHEGDWVTAQYDLPEASRLSGLSQYELLTLMGARLAR